MARQNEATPSPRSCCSRAVDGAGMAARRPTSEALVPSARPPAGCVSAAAMAPERPPVRTTTLGYCPVETRRAAMAPASPSSRESYRHRPLPSAYLKDCSSRGQRSCRASTAGQETASLRRQALHSAAGLTSRKSTGWLVTRALPSAAASTVTMEKGSEELLAPPLPPRALRLPADMTGTAEGATDTAAPAPREDREDGNPPAAAAEAITGPPTAAAAGASSSSSTDESRRVASCQEIRPKVSPRRMTSSLVAANSAEEVAKRRVQ